MINKGIEVRQDQADTTSVRCAVGKAALIVAIIGKDVDFLVLVSALAQNYNKKLYFLNLEKEK